MDSSTEEHGGSSGERAGRLQLPTSLDLGRGFLAAVDVVVDEVQIPGHLGVDAGAVCESTAVLTAVTHDAHLHEASGCVAHQWAAIVPLWKHRNIHTHWVGRSTLLLPC